MLVILEGRDWEGREAAQRDNRRPSLDRCGPSHTHRQDSLRREEKTCGKPPRHNRCFGYFIRSSLEQHLESSFLRHLRRLRPRLSPQKPVTAEAAPRRRTSRRIPQPPPLAPGGPGAKHKASSLHTEDFGCVGGTSWRVVPCWDCKLF